jgi:hypothetical protein
MKSIYVKGFAPAIEYVPFLDYNLSLGCYQEKCRIYLDEYEVEEWDYIPLFDNTFVMKKFMVKK